jgi:hypothetical protein
MRGIDDRVARSQPGLSGAKSGHDREVETPSPAFALLKPGYGRGEFQIMPTRRNAHNVSLVARIERSEIRERTRR